jgi:hypothetical protein
MKRTTRLVLVLCSIAAGLVLGEVAHAQVGRSVGVLDANLASEKDLLAVPNVTPAIAKAIASGRPFASVTPLNTLLSPSLEPDSSSRSTARCSSPSTSTRPLARRSS